MNKIKRTIVIVLDSAGCGALPDAADFGDAGANTLGHITQILGGLKVPIMQEMGLGNIVPLTGIPPTKHPTASWGIMMERSRGKDTMAGHWEMMGLIVEKPFPTFPNGFPNTILDEFCQATQIKQILGNTPASGTEIITQLGDQHMKTGFPIVYTSADSVFQIAAHEEIFPVPQLYDMCEKARKICDKYQIGRVIARPFIGTNGQFKRTPKRKGYPMDPPTETVLDTLKKNQYPVMGIGKIEDIFAGKGITRAIHTKNNTDGMKVLLEELFITREGLIFSNLVDFDMVYGHRNDVAGYGTALELFDRQLSEILPLLQKDDLLIITADHGCDPAFPGTDHTREHVPLLAYSPSIEPRPLGTRQTFADVGTTILDLFGITHSFPGKSIF